MDSKNKKFIVIGMVALIAIAVIAIGFFSSSKQPLFTLASSNTPTMKVAWMSSWADPGLIVEALKNTDILKNNNSKVDFATFTYGPPIVEAALAKKVDVVLLGWVPTVNLLAKSDDWTIIGRLITWNMYVMVNKDSNIYNIADLKGKTLGIGFGTGPYPIVIKLIEDSGLIIGKDVTLVNIAPADQGLALQTHRVDAIAWTEPLYSTLNAKGTIRVIEKVQDFGFITVSKDYLKNNPENVRNFLKAYKEANLYVAQNKDDALNWYAKESNIDFGLVKSFDIIEPNFNVKTIADIDIGLTDENIQNIQTKTDFEYSHKIISKDVNIANYVNLNYIN